MVTNTRSDSLLCVDDALHPLPEDAFELFPAEKMTQSFTVLVKQLNVLLNIDICTVFIQWLDLSPYWLEARLRPIPEFTDTTDTDTLDLQRHRYRVPSTDTDTGSDVIAARTNVVSR